MNESRFTDLEVRALEDALDRVAAPVLARPDWADVQRRARRVRLTRSSRVLVSAAALVLAIAGVVALANLPDDEPTTVVVGSDQTATTSTSEVENGQSTAPAPARPSAILAYVSGSAAPFPDRAIVEMDSSTGQVSRVVSTLLGEESSTRMAYDRARATVYYSRVVTGCSADLLRVTSGDAPILVGLGHAPAVDNTGDRLAFARQVGADGAGGSPTPCPSDEIVVRDLTGLDTDRVIAAAPGQRVVSIDWSNDGEHLAVETTDVDGASHLMVLLSSSENLNDAAHVASPAGSSWSNPRFVAADRIVAIELVAWDGLFAERSRVTEIDIDSGEIGSVLFDVPGTVVDLDVDESGDQYIVVVATPDGNRTSYELATWYDGTLSPLLGGATSAIWLSPEPSQG